MNDDQVAEFNFHFEQAGKDLNHIIILGDYHPGNLGFWDKRKAKKAIQNFERCISINPNHWQSLFFIGKIYQRLGDHENALQYLEKALKIETINHNIPQEAAIEAMHLNMIEKGVEYSLESLKRNPNDFALLGNHAMNLLIAGLDRDAEEYINKALYLNPNDELNNRIKKIIANVIEGIEKRPTFKNSIG